MTQSVEIVTQSTGVEPLATLGKTGAREIAIGAEWLLSLDGKTTRRGMADHIGYPVHPATGRSRDTARLRGGLTFWRWCSQRGISSLCTDRREILRWLDAIAAVDLAPVTKGQMVSAVSAWFDYCVTAGYCDGNPVPAKRGGRLATRTKTSGTRSLSADERYRLQRAADHDHGRGRDARRSALIVALLAEQSIRVDELCGLRVDSITRVNGRRAITVYGKNDVARTLVLTEVTATRLDAWLAVLAEQAGGELALRGQQGRSMPLLPTRTGAPIVSSTVDRIVYRCAEAAGIEQPTGKGGVTPHVLRHTWATLARQSGVDERDIQDTLGHADISTTRRYGDGVHGATTTALDAVSAAGRSCPAARLDAADAEQIGDDLALL